VTGAAPDVLVLGGGPAGAAAARLLALWGHRVVLRTKSHPSSANLAESIPPSTQKLFDILGVRGDIDRAGFIRSTGNTVWWGSEARVETFVGGARGWQVTASELAGVLLDAASGAGVVIEGAAARDAAAHEAEAAFTLDCTGRAGVIARAADVRVAEPGDHTVAVVAAWHHAHFDLPDATHTLIESYADGWAWSVPLGDAARAVAVMVDRRRSNLARDRAAREVYDREIQKTTRFRALLADAAMVDGPFGWDASMYSSSRYIVDNALLVGDAASFIDPLSSAGIKKALASAWLAAVAVHTSLVRPSMRQAALDFYAAREADVYRAFRAMARRFLAGAAAVYDHPFWSDRTDPEEYDDDRADVEAAFRRIRQCDAVRLRRSGEVRIESLPAVSGREIVLEPRLVTLATPQGVRFVADVDVLTLVDLAPSAGSIPDLFDAYNRHAAPVGLPEFLTALSTAVARRWLVIDAPP
jgi:flavin-dependent dehydrogenase